MEAYRRLSGTPFLERLLHGRGYCNVSFSCAMRSPKAGILSSLLPLSFSLFLTLVRGVGETYLCTKCFGPS